MRQQTTAPRRTLLKLIVSTAVVSLFAVVGIFAFGKPSTVEAACSANPSYGTDSVQVNVTTAGTYYAWVRLQSPDGTNNQVMMNVDNGATCYTMGKTMAANTWTWDNTLSGSSTRVSFSLSAGSHTLLFTGNQQGVGLDEVQLLTDANCTPSGTANNCTINQPTPPSVSISAPANNATVSGTVALTAAATDANSTPSVQFAVDGTNVGSSITSSPYTFNWNSTTVADGSHTITATATNGAGLTNSAQVTVTVANHVCSGTPSAPTNVRDTDTSPLPANKVDLAWGAVTPPSNCTLAGYNVYRGTSASNLVKITSSPITTATYNDTTVSAGTNYFYQVSAVDTTGTSPESTKAPATPLSVTTGQNCTQGSGAPTAPTLTVTSNSNYTQVPLSWTASTDSNGCTLSGYHVFRVGTATPIYTGTATTFTDTGADLSAGNLSSGTSYTYYVQAYDSGSNTTNSAQKTATTKADDQAPILPSTPAASATGSNAVNITWSGSTDLPNPGATGVGGYKIYRCTGTNCTTFSTALASVSATTLSFTDSTVSPSTTYGYVITAFDNATPANEDSTASAVIKYATTSGVVQTCTGNPSTPGNPTQTSNTMTSITFNWAASTPASNCTLSTYKITRGGTVLSTQPSTNSFTDSGLIPGNTYVYTVQATDTSGHVSSQSTSASLSTAADTQAPSNPTNFTAAVGGPNSAVLNWSPSTDNVSVAGYNLFRNGSATPVNSSLITTTGYTDTTLSPSTTYSYTVQAVDTAGNVSSKVASVPPSITTQPQSCSSLPSAPTGVTRDAVTNTGAVIHWTGVSAPSGCTITGYNIFRNGSSTPVNATPVSATSFTDSGLTGLTAYSYTIKAVDGAGSSPASTPALTLATTGPSNIVGDLTDAGSSANRVDIFDAAILFAHWNQACTPSEGDLDGNGTCNLFDASMMFANWSN